VEYRLDSAGALTGYPFSDALATCSPAHPHAPPTTIILTKTQIYLFFLLLQGSACHLLPIIHSQMSLLRPSCKFSVKT
jgi:hypothetical protein